MKNLLLSLVAFVVLLNLPTAGYAGQSTKCTSVISALPAVITKGGVHCLNRSFFLHLNSGVAIEILKDRNVVVDLNGYTINNLGARVDTTAIGIQATDRRNITVKNGTINGFLRGIYLRDTQRWGSEGHIVENLRLDENRGEAIRIEGQQITVRNNTIMRTGGSPHLEARGIVGFGNRNSISKNVIYAMGQSTPNPALRSAVAIDVAQGNWLISGNRISGAGASSGPGRLFGILHSGLGGSIIVNNEVDNPLSMQFIDSGAGIRGGAQLRFDGTPSSVCKDNVVYGSWAVPCDRCADGGENFPVCVR